MTRKNNRHLWSAERLVVRDKRGNPLAEWNKGSQGKTERFFFPKNMGFGGKAKRTHHKNGRTHCHWLFAHGGKNKSWR
jgi:hypothetical protein